MNIISKMPASVLLFDVRPKSLYDQGHILSVTIHVEPSVLINRWELYGGMAIIGYIVT